MIYSLIFYIFASMLVILAMIVISTKNPIFSVFSLIGCFIATAGLFIIIGAEYLAMTLVIVYVGAVAVLFLFVIMMLDVKKSEYHSGFSRYLPFVVLLALFLAADMYILFDRSLRVPMKNIGLSSPIMPQENISNTKSIGLILYTEYLIAFQISGLILFLAMIVSISLTLRERKRSLKQNNNYQLARNKNNTIELVNVKTGEGV